jgi:hypothetical protein
MTESKVSGPTPDAISTWITTTYIAEAHERLAKPRRP